MNVTTTFSVFLKVVGLSAEAFFHFEMFVCS